MPEEIITSLKIFGSALLLIGFFYFLFIRAFNTKNYKRKSLYMFISGLVIFMFFVGGLIFDLINHLELDLLNINYFAYLIVSFVFMVCFTLFYYIKGYKLKQRFKSNFSKPIKADLKPTIKNKKEYLYIIFKLENNFVLKKIIEKEEITYKGIVVKFPHNEFFHDELVNEFISNQKLDIISYNFIGKATKKEKNDIIHYVYKVLLNTKPETISDLEEIDSYKLLSMNLKEEDKKVIFTSVIQDNFDIEI